MAYNEILFAANNVRVKTSGAIGEVSDYDKVYDLYEVWATDGKSVFLGYFKEDDLEPVIYF
jgi:hypothetical protein